jgi:hypothetical protein
MLNRRELMLGSLAAWIAPPIVQAAEQDRMPSRFFAHGSSFLARDETRGSQLAALAGALPRRPSGIVIFTPHVRAERITIAALGLRGAPFRAAFAR